MKEFNQISDEKFEALETAFNNSNKQLKNLKINYIDIQDFKNIEGISTELGDWNIIGWYNANWKSSFTEAILTAIQWQKFYWNWKVSPSALVKNWENKATIKLLIKWKETDIFIERTFSKWTAKKPAWNSTLEASLNWEKISQATLDELLNALTIDPLKLWNLSISEQIKEIKATTGLDTSEIDQEIKTQEESTKESRAYKKQAQAVFDNITMWWVPQKVEEVSMSELFEKRKIFEERELKLVEYQNQKARVENLEFQISELQEKLKNEKLKLDSIKWEWLSINEKIKSEWLTNVEDLDKQINEIEANNQKVIKYNEYLSKKDMLLKCSKDLENEEEKLSTLRSQRADLVANSKLPPYLTISEELGIMVDWIEYKLLNTAKKIEVAIDLVLISWSPLRMIRIENGGELDTKTLSAIKSKIIENNFQIFLERPIIDKYDSIIINDWELLDWVEKDNFINNQ